MDQIRRLLESLSIRQRIAIGTAAAAVLLGLFLLQRYQREADYTVLFSQLGAEDGAAVVARLKERSIDYRLSEDGSAVRGPSRQVADLRLEMAAAGIPKTGRIGFELFDKTNFGATEFAEQVNYHRALEGELERTVMTVAEVEHARIHITPPKDSVFEDQRRPAKASVLLKLRPGARLAPQNIKAITHLVSAAVEGLAPEAVSVLDVHGTLLTKPLGQQDDEILNQSLLAYKRSVEKDLLSKLHATLEPLLGPDRFRAAVSVDLDLSSSEESEESYDPDRSVMTASQRSEETAASQTTQGVPGVPSNLPRPTSRPGGAGQAVNRRSENLNFQTSRVLKKVRMPQGDVRRVSASVLLDHIVRWEGTGAKARRVVEPPGAERIKATRDLVAAAIGFRQDRGDLVVVESLPFEQTLTAPAATKTAPAPGPIGFLRDGSGNWNVAVIGALGGAVVVLVALVVFLLARRKKTVVQVAAALPAASAAAGHDTAVAAGEFGEPPALDGAEPAARPGLHGLPGSESGGLIDIPNDTSGPRLQEQLAAELARKLKLDPDQEKEILAALTSNVKTPSTSTKKAEVLAKHLSEMGRKNAEGLAQIMRTWITNDEV